MGKKKPTALKWLITMDKSTTSKTNAKHKDIDSPIEDNSQEVGNTENNDDRNQEIAEAIDEDAMQVEEDFKVDMNERTTRDATANPVVKRKHRGPTKVKRLPVNPLSCIEVEFNADCKPIGDGFVKLSSYLGPQVREYVPITLDRLKELSDTLQVALWGCIQVLRDVRWSEEDATILVPGDTISIKLGDIVPADARLLEGDPLKIDQFSLTGESLSVTRNPGDEVFSGSTCKQGEIEAVIIAIGVHTFFGKAAHLIESTNQVSHFQKVLIAIGNFCVCSIAIGMIIEIIVMYLIQKRQYRSGIDN